MTITIDQDGTVRMIYADALLPLMQALGTPQVRRASNVEPTEDGRWQADLSPVGGPVLPPTRTRQESLDLEVQWLEENVL